MRRCAICGGGNDVLAGWYTVPQPLCAPCRQAIRSHYRRGPVRHRTDAGRQAWVCQEVCRRLSCPANTGQQAGMQQASGKERAA